MGKYKYGLEDYDFKGGEHVRMEHCSLYWQVRQYDEETEMVILCSVRGGVIFCEPHYLRLVSNDEMDNYIAKQNTIGYQRLAKQIEKQNKKLK